MLRSPKRRATLFLPLLMALAPVPAGQQPSETHETAPAAVSTYEVRLRKLHLVRPDLIPYPIAFEVCC